MSLTKNTEPEKIQGTNTHPLSLSVNLQIFSAKREKEGTKFLFRLPTQCVMPLNRTIMVGRVRGDRTRNELTKIKGSEQERHYFFPSTLRRQWTGIKARHQAGVIVLRPDKIHGRLCGTCIICFLSRQRFPAKSRSRPECSYNQFLVFIRAYKDTTFS